MPTDRPLRATPSRSRFSKSTLPNRDHEKVATVLPNRDGEGAATVLLNDREVAATLFLNRDREGVAAKPAGQPKEPLCMD